VTTNFKDLGAQVSNWGRWGPDDQIGTLNLVAARHIQAAAVEVRSGKVLQLSIPVGMDGPQSGMGGRINPVHLMSMQPGDWDPHGLQVADDWIVMPLQSGTQWDALSHVAYDGKLYNGYSTDEVGTRYGARQLAVDALTDRIVGRGCCWTSPDSTAWTGSKAGRPSRLRTWRRPRTPKASRWARPTSCWCELVGGRDCWPRGATGG